MGDVEVGALGRIGYEAYAELTGWKSLATGDQLPQWNVLNPRIQAAWEAAAQAIANEAIRIFRGA